MWIVTKDNLHDAKTNPAGRIPQSKDFLANVARKKTEERRHVFRLLFCGIEMFQGVAYFSDDARFSDVLRPLDEFGRSYYDCDEIQYLVSDMSIAPNIGHVWNTIHEDLAREADDLIHVQGMSVREQLLDPNGFRSVSDVHPVALRNFVHYARVR